MVLCLVSLFLYQTIEMKVNCSALLAVCFLATTARCRPTQPQDLSLDSATCDSRSDWTASNFLKEDCFKSVLDVYLQDYRPHPQSKFKFYASLFPPPPGSNMIQTPRRYTTKSCTLALVMLYKFGSTELPGTFKPGHARTDFAAFEEIYTAARKMESNCIVGHGQTSRLAWEPVGETKSIGVFFWATNSRINNDPRYADTVNTINLTQISVF